jgi:hypothetical protein
VGGVARTGSGAAGKKRDAGMGTDQNHVESRGAHDASDVQGGTEEGAVAVAAPLCFRRPSVGTRHRPVKYAHQVSPRPFLTFKGTSAKSDMKTSYTHKYI